MLKTYLGMAVLVTVLAPHTVEADWLFTPTAGRTFGGDTFGRDHLTYGAAISWLDEELFGWEAEVSYAPDFFDGSGDAFAFTGEGSLVSLMGNVLIGTPIGGPDGRLRPYVTGGVGLMQMQVISDGGTFETDTHEAGFNLGAGAMAFLTPRIAVRGDLRYLRSFQNQVPSWTRGTTIDIAPGNFDYWRGSIGLTFRFTRE